MKNATELIDILIKGMDDVSKTEDHSEINKMIKNILSEMMDSEFISFLLFDKSNNSLYSVSDGNQKPISMADPTGLLGNSYLTKQAALYNHVKSEKLYNAQVDNPKDRKIKSQVIYPLIENDEIIGMLITSRSIKQSQNYTNYDISLLKSVEPYLFKMVHILLNDTKGRVSIDQSDINTKVKDVAKNAKGDNAEINDTVMFLANTVHDIRTPANGLYGFLELMEEQIDDPKLLDFISGAKESAEFINTLTDSILDRVKHESEVQNAEPVTVNSVKFLSKIANIFTANMTTKKIHYLVDIDPSIPKEIKIDDVKLKRVLINLIGNAYKFTPSDKTIEFKVIYDQEKHSLKFSVEDQGLGIPKERQKEIFKAFEQAQEDTSIHFGGTGLGLAISSKYVQDLGGTLNLESEVDEGSTFFFEIPIETIDPEPKYIPFHDLDKKIVIYTDNKHCIDANNMKNFLVKLSMPEGQVLIGDKIKKGTTHLFCFEHKFDDKIIEQCKEQNIKLVVFEEELFSISKQSKYKDLKTIAKNTYYENVLYSTVSSRKKPRVFIVDDNRVNIKLLESILEGVYCDVYHDIDAKNGLEKLKKALVNSNPYDVVFLDKHMPDLSGTELLKEYRKFEDQYSYSKPIYSVSITGDVTTDEEEKKLYDLFLKKPFKSNDIREVFNKI
jgi:two-component system sensor histidine kinase BarA